MRCWRELAHGHQRIHRLLTGRHVDKCCCKCQNKAHFHDFRRREVFPSSDILCGCCGKRTLSAQHDGAHEVVFPCMNTHRTLKMTANVSVATHSLYYLYVCTISFLNSSSFELFSKTSLYSGSFRDAQDVPAQQGRRVEESIADRRSGKASQYKRR